MKSNKEYFIKFIKKEQTDLILIIISSVFLAFGINIISNFFYDFFNIASSLKLLFGSVVCVIAFYFLLSIFFKNYNTSLKYSPFFLYNRETNEIINVPGYSFCNDLRDYLKAASIESTGIKGIWEKISLNSIHDSNGEQNQRNFIQMKKLIEELTESIVLYDLSTKLTDYFNDPIFVNENFRTFERKDLVEIWSNNRIIDLISRPLEERPHIDNFDECSSNDPHICAAYDPDGSIFQELDLRLPKNSKIKKENNNLIIENDHLKIQFVVEFDGYNTNLPHGFTEYRLKLDDLNDQIIAYQIDIFVEIKVKPLSVLLPQGWKHIMWIDSYIDLIRKYDEEEFFNQINWETVNVILSCLKISNDKFSLTHLEENSNGKIKINSNEKLE